MVDTFLLAKSFVTLLVITDPVGTVPIFLAITAEWGTRDRNRAAWQAVVVAALVIATFACSANSSSSTWESPSRACRSPGGCCCW
jgi:multiple antibiotic resistance protein